MINKLSREFSIKSEQERKEMFADMLCSPVMHTNCTNAKVNGRSAYVFVCATPGGKAMYFSRDKKGHEGVKGTFTENYQGILVHDHEKAFFKYGTDHHPSSGSKINHLSLHTIRNRQTALFFITFAGWPTATEYGGIGFTTVDPAPITEPSPILPEYIIHTPIPT